MGQLFTQTYTNQTTSWLVFGWGTFGARMSHMHTHTHETQHDSNLEEATTFFLRVLSMSGHGACTQISFCPMTPKLGILKFPKLGLLQLWRPITFCADLRLKWGLKKIVKFVKSFPMIWHTTCANKSRRFLTFNGWKSNWQFDSRPFFRS